MLNRRRFAKVSAAAAVTAFMVTPTLSEVAKPPLSPSPFDHRPDDLSPADWDEAHARYTNLLRVYGTRLSAEEKQRVERILLTNQRMLASIRSFELQNGDASACTLRLTDAQS
jgi:hypothetical protein